MNENKKAYLFLFFILLIDFFLLLWVGKNLSISFYEAQSFFNPRDFAGYYAKLSVSLFGRSDIGLRIGFLFLHLCNGVLMFLLAKTFLKRPSDAVFCALLFLLLPGVNAGAILISNSGIVIFFSLLLCLWHQKTQKFPYWLLLMMAFVDKSFSLVFLALIFYGIAHKNTFLVFASLVCFAVNMYLFDLGIGGHPESHFVDMIGHLLLIFSPLVFLYFLYMIYRFANSKAKPLMWYIVVVALSFIFIFSLRQRVDIESFTALLIVGIPLMVNLYYSGLRVRLPKFKGRYKIPFKITLAILLCMTGLLIFSKPLFVVLSNEENHFAYRHYIAQELAKELKEQKIKAVRTEARMQERLLFYGIQKGGRKLSQIPKKDSIKIPIIYYDKEVTTFYVK